MPASQRLRRRSNAAMVDATIRAEEAAARRDAARRKRISSARASASAVTTTSNVIRLIKAQAGETKYFDTSFAKTITSAGGDWADTEVTCSLYMNSVGVAAPYTDCSLIPSANGSAYGQVAGNRYRLVKLRVRGTLKVAVQTAQTVVDSGNITRLMLVMDTQPNGVQAQGEDIMNDMGTALTNPYSFKRVSASSGRYRILKDEIYSMEPRVAANNNAATTVSIGFEHKDFSMQYQPLEPMQVNIKSGNATPTIAGLVDCNIFLLCFSSSLDCTVYGQARAYFKDA